MDCSIAKLLQKNRVEGTIHSHVSLSGQKGKFQLDRKNLETFWNLYCSGRVERKEKFIVGIAEKPQQYIPVLVDVDIKKERKTQTQTQIYSEKHIIETVAVYQSILRKLIEDCQDENLWCVVLEKPSYKVVTGGKEFVKNGFHLHFPNSFINKQDQELQLLPNIKHEIGNQKIFDDLNLTADEVIDCGYLKSPWLLYGSKKEVDSKNPYKISYIIDENGTKCDYKEKMNLMRIFDSREVQIEFTEDIEFYIPRILSVIPYGRDVCEVNCQFSNSVCGGNIPSVKKIKDLKQYKILSVEENLRQAADYLPLLDSSRCDDHNNWIMIGWILFNISEGTKEGLDLWIQFSHGIQKDHKNRGSPGNFNDSVCVHEWSKMVQKDISIGSLKHFAKMDNPDGYASVIYKFAKEHIDKSINGSHNDIAKALFEIYSQQFVCSSLTYKIWYEFINNQWKLIEEGNGLRCKISDEIVRYYEKTAGDLVKEMAVCKDGDKGGEIKRKFEQVFKIMTNLKQSPFKNNVMREAMEVFYDGEFVSRLNANPWLIGFKNGLYDLKNNIFREGRPDDFISLQLGVNYNTTLTMESDAVIQVKDFLNKVFPDKSVKQYFLDSASDVFVGGNANKIVQVWSGEGDNGKSVTQTMFEKMLGEYSVKLPTALITGKRTQSSAACPELVRAGNGVRWAVLQEPDKKDVLNIGILKELSGNDTFYARTLHREGGEINPMFKLVLICNEPPQVPHDDKATWNRIRVVPFESTFCDNPPDTEEEQLLLKKFPKDPHFTDKIPSLIEAFAWYLLEHKKTILGMKRVEPEKVRLATANYRKKNDTYRQFIEECIIEKDGVSLSLAELYSNFKEWFKDSLPNQSMPVKNEVKEYFTKIWGEYSGIKRSWKGFKIRTMEDDMEGGAENLEDSDDDGISFED